MSQSVYPTSNGEIIRSLKEFLVAAIDDGSNVGFRRSSDYQGVALVAGERMTMKFHHPYNSQWQFEVRDGGLMILSSRIIGGPPIEVQTTLEPRQRRRFV